MIIAGPRIKGFERLETNTLYAYKSDPTACIICGTKGAMEEHHVIPQAAGGVNSPRVLLCNSCHDGIHDACVKKLQPAEYTALPDAKQRWTLAYQVIWAAWLMRHIVGGDETTKADPNRRTSIKVRLNRAEDRIVQRAQRMLQCSKEEAIRHMVRNFDETSLHRPAV